MIKLHLGVCSKNPPLFLSAEWTGSWSTLVEGDEQPYQPRGNNLRNDALTAETKKYLPSQKE